MQNPEHKRSDNWYFPPDLAAAIAPIAIIIFLLLAVCGVSLVTAVRLYRLGICLGGIGVVLLLVARLPIYRQRHFFAVGPSAVSGIYRKIYWLAYLFIIPSILFLGFALLFLRR